MDSVIRAKINMSYMLNTYMLHMLYMLNTLHMLYC